MSYSNNNRTIKVLVVGSVLFTFISYWRTAAIVLCDLASTIYYIGGIVEQAIGTCAPWFIAAVMIFSYAVRSVYLESCSIFVRGGVYRVVRSAMGAFLGKLAVSALMFDYVLTGPISAVSAGQYIFGLLLEVLERYQLATLDKPTKEMIKAGGSVLFAVLVTLYFWWLNVKGVHESSGKALKIMITTSIMAALIIGWCGLTIMIDGTQNPIPSWQPDFKPKMNYDAGEVQDPLGFLSSTSLGERLREGGAHWWEMIGIVGLLIAFGHSILAMSGEETLAQVYREVEAPKMKNFKKAAFIVFLFSFIVTPTICFLAVVLIPDAVRMPDYSGNLIGGLAMNVIGPIWLRLMLNAFVVVVGALILSGAVNTAIIGSNGVLNRVAEDGVISPWFLKPHRKYGTTYRLLTLIVILQLITIVLSRGDVIALGEAYAFGVVWSFMFNTMAMFILRFKDKSPREAKVPLNIPIGNGREIPVGIGLIFLILAATAIINLATKPTATIWGASFTAVFMTVFTISEMAHRRRHGKAGHKHVDQFNQETPEALTSDALGISKKYRKLVAIRSPENLRMLEQALAEADPVTTDLVVMTAKVVAGDPPQHIELSDYEQKLMTGVVTQAEKAGKQVLPMILPTNNALHAILTVAKEVGAQELIMGASNQFTAEEQLDQLAFYWTLLKGEGKCPIMIRIIGKTFETHLELDGGNRIPTIRERVAKSVAELRAAGIGVRKVLFLHEGKSFSADLFEDVLTMLDEDVVLGIVHQRFAVKPPSPPEADVKRAAQVGRTVATHELNEITEEDLHRLVRDQQYELLVVPLESQHDLLQDSGWMVKLLDQPPCSVCLLLPPVVPRETDT